MAFNTWPFILPDMRRIVPISFTLFALCVTSCAPSGASAERVEPLRDTAKRFVVDLGQPEGAVLAGWFRPDHPVSLRRRCPDCPRARRETTRTLRWGDDALALGRGIAQGRAAEVDPHRSALRAGQVTCKERCCRWGVGLLDHGATHLEEACFERDEDGAFITSLVLIDA